FGHGIDEVFVTADDLRHIRNDHGANEEKRGQVNVTAETVSRIYDTVNDFDEASVQHSDKLGNKKMMVVRSRENDSVAILIERGKRKAEVKTFYEHERKTSSVFDAHSPERNVRNDPKKSSSAPSVPQEEENGNGIPVPKMGTPIKGRTGSEAEILTDDGTPIRAKYRIVRRKDLVASHDFAGGSLTRSKNYPQELQPRDRGRVSMGLQVQKMAGELRPADLAASRNLNQGAPVIRPDGVVLNGNGRTLAIAEAYRAKGKPIKAYGKYLIDHAEDFGYRKPDVASLVRGGGEPVLVRVTEEADPAIIGRIIHSTAGGARLGAEEQASADARKITRSDLSGYVPNERGDLGTAANRDFVNGVLYRIVPESERNAYTDRNGRVGADGIARARRALFAKAYHDSALIARMAESTDDETKNVTNGLSMAAPILARVNESMRRGSVHAYPLAETITEAVKRYAGLKAEGKPMENYLQEQSVFAEYADTAEAKDILRILDGYRRSGKKIGTFLARLGELVEGQGNPNQVNLMDVSPRSLKDMIASAKDYVETGGEITPNFGRVADGAKFSVDMTEENGMREKGEGTREAEARMDWIDAHRFQYDGIKSMEANIARAESLSRAYIETFGTTDQIHTPARQKLRRKIADKLYGDGAARKEGKAWLVLGVPASGKSTFSDTLIERDGALLIDSDEAKKLLPEFSDGLLAGAVHEESAKIADYVLARAMANRDNVVLPLVGKTIASLQKRIDTLSNAGCEVHLIYVDLPIEKAIERTKARFRETGRLVSPSYLQKVGLKPKQNYDKLKVTKGVDSYEAWDSDVVRGSHPRLIERSIKSEQKANLSLFGGRRQYAGSLGEGSAVRGSGEKGSRAPLITESRSDKQDGFSHALQSAAPESRAAVSRLAKAMGGTQAADGKHAFATPAEEAHFQKAAMALLRAMDANTQAKDSVEGVRYSAAWHGSPHQFEEFSLDHIGTGEGAQAHGWGLYFAKEYSTAEGYRGSLGEPAKTVVFDGDTYQKPDGFDVWVFDPHHENILEGEWAKNALLDTLYEHEFNSAQEARDYFEKELRLQEDDEEWGETDYSAEQLRKILGLLSPENQYSDEIDVLIEPPGAMYHVEIANEDAMLDEQKPIGEQPAEVLQGLRRVVGSLSASELETFFRRIGYRESEDGKERGEGAAETYFHDEDAMQNRTGRDFYRALAAAYESDRNASQTLNAYGIKGIAYEGRQDGRCYVMFDDQAIEILEKFSAKGEGAKLRQMLAAAKFLKAGNLTAEERNLSALGEEMGTPVVWMDGDASLHGFHSGGVTFLNRRSEMRLPQVFWHESFHYMRA
ncbi:zeta toxin family protein, partial [uncultured Mitsuokella sp.]|uniref:zeta toxin family protein n=1 Tax=uncultured Mitsuokella sp. TaxID=453120 RepID=UPI0026113011